MRTRPIIASLLLLSSLSVGPSSASSAPADSSAKGLRLLAEVKAATGGVRWNRIATWHERGTFRTGDQTGSYDSWVDFRRFRAYTELRYTGGAFGAFRERSGWNGRVSWSADKTGDVRVEESQESRNGAIGNAYFEAFGYLFAARRQARVEAMAPQMADGNQCDVVRVTPGGSDPVELWIDHASRRVLRSASVKGDDKRFIVVSDFRQVAGVTVPFKSAQIGEPSEPEQSNQITTIEINHAAPAGIFDPPQPRFTDVEFPANQDSVTLDFRMVNGQIRIPVSVNGQRFDDFLFDTGAPTGINMTTARSLGMKIEITGTAHGGGTGSALAGLTKVDLLEVGAVKSRGQILTAVDDVSPSDIEGWIGYETVKRTIVVLDFARHRITFIKPGAFRPPDRAVALPLRFADRGALVEASVDGNRGEFLIDTGSAASLLVHRPFAEQHGLIEKHHAVHEVQAGGVGGSAPIVLFRPDQFTLGPLHLPAPVGGIFLSHSGEGATEHVAGNIGNGILRRFTVTFDYAHRRVYFQPNATFPEPDVIAQGWSGLLVIRNAGSRRVEVVELENDSPAAQAGILKGDGILAINASSLDAYTDDQLDEALNAAPGTVVVLTIQRGNDIREVNLITKPLI